MNGFDKKIREALFTSPENSHSSHSLSDMPDSETFSTTPTLSFKSTSHTQNDAKIHIPTARLRLNYSNKNSNHTTDINKDKIPDNEYNKIGFFSKKNKYSTDNLDTIINNNLPSNIQYPSVDPNALTKPGIMMGNWDNPLIAAAIPTLLQVERVQNQGQVNPATVRAQMVREIQFFQRKALKEKAPHEDVDNLAYLLCAYVDECCMIGIGGGTLNLSLLVEFYRDSWGGEKCFLHLQNYLSAPQRDKNILAFYNLILSLGFEGQYRVIERGNLLLSDIKNYLNNYLYYNENTNKLSDAEADKQRVKKNYITPFRIFFIGSLISIGIYGTGEWYLHDQSASLKNAILAWNPPIPHKINIMETLPQPLPKILDEGWLQIRPDPRGWLLIFTSDGAFANGKSQLSEEFKQKRNIERLGAALAPWPGDLEVIGHTDNSQFANSSKNSNLKLSAARAEVVAQALREALTSSKYNRTITSVGKGDSDPLDTNNTEEGRRRNRRVDMLWKIGQRASSENK